MAKTIQYAVMDDGGCYYTNDVYHSDNINKAKLWKTRAGANRLAKEWGSGCKPRPVNKVVEVEVVVRTSRKLTSG